MDRLQKLGRDLGYEGKDLQNFVALENKRERDERRGKGDRKSENRGGGSEISTAARD